MYPTAARPLQWFDSLFDGVNPDEKFISPNAKPLREWNTETCIIDDPTRKLAYPLISFDVGNQATKIIDIAKMPISRGKPLIAIVRGVGGGKTRCLVELEQQLLKHQGAVAVAITFNSFMEIDEDDYKWNDSSCHCYAFAIVSRMACVFYNKPIHSIRRLFKEKLQSLTKIYEPQEFIQDFVVHIATKLSKHRHVEHFVLLVDETVQMEEVILRKFKEEDVTRVVRSALLNGKFEFGGTKINVALVISSLKLSPIGFTDSGREIYPLVLPERVDEKEIVEMWWLKNITSKVHSLTRLRLIMIASVMGSLPRVVEMTEMFLQEYIQEQQELQQQEKEHKLLSDKDFVDEKFLSSLFDNLLERIRNRYSPVFPSSKMIHALVFQTSVQLNEEVMELLRCSVFTNSLKIFDPKSKIIPQASIVMLVCCASLMEEETLIATHFKSIQPLLQNVVAKIKGNVLERFVATWLAIRLQTAFDNPLEPLWIGRLFGVEVLPENAHKKLFTILNTEVAVPKKFTMNRVDKVNLPSSYNDESEFCKKLCSVTSLSCDSPLVIFRPDDNEAFDIGIAVLDSNQAYVIFIDTKSADEFYDHNKNDDQVGLKDMKQYHHMKNVFKKNKMDNELGSAINNGRFLYVYLSTHDCDSKFNESDVMVLRRNETKRFFGPLWDLYCSARATSSSGIVTNTSSD